MGPAGITGFYPQAKWTKKIACVGTIILPSDKILRKKINVSGS